MILPGLPAIFGGPGAYVPGVTSFISADVSANTGIPTHAAGDLILCALVLNSATSLPSGFTNIADGTIDTKWYRLCYKIAASASESESLSGVPEAYAVYRSSTGIIGIGNVVSQTGIGMPRTYPANTPSQPDGWIVGVGFYEFTDGTQDPPTGMTQRGESGYAAGSTIISDTNSDVSSWSATNVSDASSGDWISFTVEITT